MSNETPGDGGTMSDVTYRRGQSTGGANVDQESNLMGKYLQKLGQDWAAAELRGDAVFLEHTLADDFVGIGPRGFMLTKEQWLARYESGDLKHQSFQLGDVQVCVYEDAAVMRGHETIKGRYKGQDLEGRFRTTLVFVKQQGHWLLAALHLSDMVEES
jgi:ketosteroid isomerase-like protein